MDCVTAGLRRLTLRKTRLRTVSVEMQEGGENLNVSNTEREKAPPRQPCLSVLRPL
jgi:hypothetical protein